jgi:hypothetical protein
MSTSTVARPRAGKIGEPTRKWVIIPRELPVPPAREDAPKPERTPAPQPEREPAAVPA